MTTTIDYALMAGASYITNRPDLNKFPIPKDWHLYSIYPADAVTGFEATTYKNGTETVISFAGTDFSLPGTDFIFANIPLAVGLPVVVGGIPLIPIQLLQAAEYYMQVKAASPVGTNITLTASVGCAK